MYALKVQVQTRNDLENDPCKGYQEAKFSLWTSWVYITKSRESVRRNFFKECNLGTHMGPWY